MQLDHDISSIWFLIVFVRIAQELKTALLLSGFMAEISSHLILQSLLSWEEDALLRQFSSPLGGYSKKSGAVFMECGFMEALAWGMGSARLGLYNHPCRDLVSPRRAGEPYRYEEFGYIARERVGSAGGEGGRQQGLQLRGMGSVH